MTNEKIDQLKGRAEQAAGDLTNDDNLQEQGQRHESAGKIKETIDSLQDKASDAIDKAQEKMDNRNDRP